MNKYRFHLNDNTFQYYGKFVSPTFSLWRDRAGLIETTFNLFSPFGVEIENISVSNEGNNLDDEAIVVSLDGLGDFKFGYGAIYWESDDMSEKELADTFEVIAYVNDKLPSVATDLKFDHHFMEFGGHGGLESGSSFRDFLQQYYEPKLKSVDQNLPSGMVFNWLDTNTQRQFHLEIDESLNIPGGLFMRWVIFFRKDRLNLSDFTESVFITMKNVLNELNLELED
jgi:hypothetical protein